MFQPPVGVLPLTRYSIVTARPPFTVKRERALFREYEIDTLVTKQSGGPTDAKLAAAREVGARVVMIRRPQPPPEIARVETVDQALAWIGPQINGRSGLYKHDFEKGVGGHSKSRYQPDAQ